MDGQTGRTDRQEPAATRAQVEPHVALVGLAVVCLGVSLYAGTLTSAIGPSDRQVASPALSAVADRVCRAGVADPSRLSRASEVRPRGYRLAVRLETADRRWRDGARPPEAVDVQAAARRVSVRLGPGDVRPGTLRVEVWE
jgi:hypothetical protein